MLPTIRMILLLKKTMEMVLKFNEKMLDRTFLIFPKIKTIKKTPIPKCKNQLMSKIRNQQEMSLTTLMISK
jgi:hypothetical protein